LGRLKRVALNPIWKKKKQGSKLVHMLLQRIRGLFSGFGRVGGKLTKRAKETSRNANGSRLEQKKGGGGNRRKILTKRIGSGAMTPLRKRGGSCGRETTPTKKLTEKKRQKNKDHG